MDTTKPAWLVIFFFLFIIFTIKSSYGSIEYEPVLDIDGMPVFYDVNYFVVSSIRGGGGGGLNITGPENEHSCPLSVTQESLDLNVGERVIFLPIKGDKDNIVRESTDLNVKFNILIDCEETTGWKVNRFEGVDGWVVTLGGDKGYHGPGTASSLFKIQKGRFPSSYKFHFCPSYPRTRLIPCSDVGILFDNQSIRRLVLKEEEKDFVFIKAEKLMNYPNIVI